MVNRQFLFEPHLKEVLPTATVKKTYRDRNGAVPAFSESPRDPVEYWVVETEGGAWLLPQPQSQDQFRELVGFEHDVDRPKVVRSVVPATLKAEPGRYLIESDGLIVG